MKCARVTCLVLLAGLTSVGLALVAAAPGQQAPPADPILAIGSGLEAPAAPSTGTMRTTSAVEASASSRPSSAAAGAEVGAAQARQAIQASQPQPAAADVWLRQGYDSSAGPFSGGAGSDMGVMGVLAADPEVAKWMKEAGEAEAEQEQLLAKYAETTDAKQKAEIKAELAKVLQRQFDLQLQHREREVSEIEARVRNLREMIEKRKTARQSIVTNRLDQVLNELDGMGWVPPTGAMPVPRGGESMPGRGVSGPGGRSSGVRYGSAYGSSSGPSPANTIRSGTTQPSVPTSKPAPSRGTPKSPSKY